MATKISYGVANIASQAEAEAGTAVDKFMTPERVIQSMKARGVITQVANPSAASEVDFTPIIPDGIYDVHFWLEATVDTNLGIATSDDNGVNFNNGTSEWGWRGMLIDDTGTASHYAGSTAFATCDISGSDGAGTVEPKMGVVSVKRLNLASADWITVEGVTSGTLGGNFVGATVWNLSAVHANGIDRIRVFPATGGTITGRIVLAEYPIS